MALAHGVSVLGTESINNIEYVALSVASGTYTFTSSWTRNAVALV